jgi:hypothetical protein
MDLTKKQKTILKLLCIGLIPLMVWTFYDIHSDYQISSAYGAEYITEAWISENTSCNMLNIQIAFKTNNVFAPSNHIPALEKWQDYMDCDNPDSEYWRSTDYNYENTEGTSINGEQIEFKSFNDWMKNKQEN